MNFDFYNFKPILMKKIIYVTHKSKKADFDRPPHKHHVNFHEIIYIDYGEIDIIISENKIRVSPGECVFISGGATHSFTGAGIPFNYLNIMFVGKLPQSLSGRSLPVNRKCLELLEKLKEESVQELSYCREIVSVILTELIVRFLRQVEFSKPNNPPESFNHYGLKSDYVKRALSVIADEYSKPLSLSSVSRASGIGKSRLHKLLKLETGKTFTEILHELRINAAKHLLNEGVFSLKNIANSVGYRSSSYFFKVFKRLTGMTPKSYALSLGEPTERE